MLPKRGMDVHRNELVRLLKLTNESVEPISFICPRKVRARPSTPLARPALTPPLQSDAFQDDLYPDTYAGRPSLKADEWFAGGNAEPIKCSMDPAKADSGAAAGVAATFTPMKSRAVLQKELDDANARIKELEEEVARLKAS